MGLDAFTRANALESGTNAEFNRATLKFKDGSHIRFEHSSRENRWARASSEGTTAETVCLALSQFRLNAKHLQLFFEDGTDVEFQPSLEDGHGPALA